MQRYSLYAIASSVSALLLLLIFPGFELPYLAWIAFIPLFLVIRNSGPGASFFFSFASGFIFFYMLQWWFLRIPGINIWNFSIPVAGLAAFFGMFGLVVNILHRRIPQWDILIFPMVWVLMEYARTHIAFLSFPWGIIGYSQYSVLPVARLASYTGVYGVSFLIIGGNIALALCFDSCSRQVSQSKNVLRDDAAGERVVTRINLSITAVFILSLLAPALLQGSATAPGENLKVGLVQANVYAKENNDRRYREDIYQKYLDLTLDNANAAPELIVWPSSSVPGKIPADKVLVDMLSDLSARVGSFLLIGSSGFEKFGKNRNRSNRTANSAFLFSPVNGITGRYDKIRLLPFDEYIPLRGKFKWPSWIVDSDMVDHEPGQEMTVFNLHERKFGVLICWENYFADNFRKMVAQGVDFMVSMTNEGFTDIPGAHYQMLAMNVFRAVENNVSIIRTASTGVSCTIGPSGKISTRIQDENNQDVNIAGHGIGLVPLSSQRTFYTRHGDLFVAFIFSVFIAINIIAFSKTTRT
jgi:apolipoprotein N-acyltransferase